MKSREQEYKEIFIAEALEYYDALSRHISTLEKSPDDEKVITEIFRLLHNLKANAKAIGYEDIADLSHKMETAFGLIRDKELSFAEEIVPALFDAVDLLGQMMNNLDDQSFHFDPTIVRNLELVIENAGEEKSNDLMPVQREGLNKNLSLSDLIYIQIKKLDHLLNLVGELIIDRDRIISISKDLGSDELKSVSSHLYRITEELQYSVMDARLVGIGSLFNKFPRVVRDVAFAEQKDVAIEITGHDIQIDRNILQLLTDPLLHLVRNAVSHGIELPEDRVKAGKPLQGTIDLRAANDRDIVLIEIADDGAGIDIERVKQKAQQRGLISPERAQEISDTEVLSLLFEPGFSMSKEITEFSGRGVGLDVVKNALDSVGGRIKVESVLGKGTTFSLYLPTSIAVTGALLFEVEETYYAIPLIHTDSVVALESTHLHEVGDALVSTIKGEPMTIVYLKELLNSEPRALALGDKTRLPDGEQNVIIVTYNNRRLGLVVDRLVRQQDIVVKPLNKPLDTIELYGGVTLLGTGKVCFVLDVPAIVKYVINRH